jgi:hypothetical protein
MGSFYALCSITNKTIVDGQKMIVQLMLPGRYDKVDSGNMFVDSVLRVAEKDGLEKALSTWKQATQDWGAASELGKKGMIVSNETPCMSWVPFGPAIRGVYDDCGDIATDTDPENLARIDLLEKILCAPFQSIMGAATDDRWYTIGIKREDKGWQQEGLNSETPEFAMEILKKLSVTYMHAGAYDVLKEFDFCPEHGKMRSKYDVEWKNEYLDEVKKKLPEFIQFFSVYEKDSLTESEKLERDIKFYEIDRLGAPFRNMDRKKALIYLTSLYREKADLEWYYEQLSFLYSLGGMHMNLQPTMYVSQNQNSGGWDRINEAMKPSIQEMTEKYGWNEEEEDEE